MDASDVLLASVVCNGWWRLRSCLKRKVREVSVADGVRPPAAMPRAHGVVSQPSTLQRLQFFFRDVRRLIGCRYSISHLSRLASQVLSSMPCPAVASSFGDLVTECLRPSFTTLPCKGRHCRLLADGLSVRLFNKHDGQSFRSHTWCGVVRRMFTPPALSSLAFGSSAQPAIEHLNTTYFKKPDPRRYAPAHRLYLGKQPVRAIVSEAACSR